MTDLEMTKLCAEAMGLNPDDVVHDELLHVGRFAPLTNDAQAMALVKRFDLLIDSPRRKAGQTEWCVTFYAGCFPGSNEIEARYADLNRAIVECVALMQSAKEPA